MLFYYYDSCCILCLQYRILHVLYFLRSGWTMTGGRSWSILVVFSGSFSYCEDRSFYFLHLFRASASPAAMSRSGNQVMSEHLFVSPAAMPTHLFISSRTHFLLRDESDVYSWMSAFSAWITEHAISPGISCHILTRPTFNLFFIKNMPIVAHHCRNIK